MNQPTTLDEAKRATGLSIGMALLLIALGMTALLFPGPAGVAVTVLVLWIIVFSGMAHLVHAWDARGSGVFVWQLLVGAAYLCGGIYLLLHPGYGVAYVTLVIAGMFMFEAILLWAAFYWLRYQPAASWLALDGTLTLILAICIGVGWPSDSIWVLGTLVGVNVLVSGFTRLAMSDHPGKLFKLA
jgi:uncharacterized membrane protein HdeD (DUF308 family)